MRISTNSSFTKTFRKGIWLSFMLVMIAYADRSYGQDLTKKITLHLEGATVEQGINEIAGKAGAVGAPDKKFTEMPFL